MFKRLTVYLSLALALTVPALALAQTDIATSATREPSIDAIYKAAESGKFSEADSMIARVLAAHPASAKAYFVHAELLAKEGKLGAAKTAYAKAEELAPGLPFAKPEAVAGLLQRFDGSAARPASTRGTELPSRNAMSPAPQSQSAESPGLGTPAKTAIVVLLIAAGFFMFRRISGARTGTGGTGGTGGATGAPITSQTGYAPGSMAQPNNSYPPSAVAAPSGLGSALMTGAAVGLGAVAVEEVVRHFSQRDRPDDLFGRRRDQPAFDNNLGPDTNADMGGSDFGISDAGSWDSGGGGGGDSSSDW